MHRMEQMWQDKGWASFAQAEFESGAQHPGRGVQKATVRDRMELEREVQAENKDTWVS